LGDEGECLGLAVFGDQLLLIVLGGFITAQEQASCLGEGPFEVYVADLAVFGSGFLSG
jgi:hypothetical protein